MKKLLAVLAALFVVEVFVMTVWPAKIVGHTTKTVTVACTEYEQTFPPIKGRQIESCDDPTP